jgi:hypothetical protein
MAPPDLIARLCEIQGLIVRALPPLEEHEYRVFGRSNVSQQTAFAYLGSSTNTTDEQFQNYDLWESLQWLRRAQHESESAIAAYGRLPLPVCAPAA